MSATRKQNQKQSKTARVPFGGARYRLQLSKQDMETFKERKMVPHWFNDQDGRIQRALGAGYNFVKPEHAMSLGQGALHRDNSDPESNARVSVVTSRGEPIIRSYLMEISEKYHKQDQKAKEAINAKVDESLKAGGGDVENAYGPGVSYSH